MNLLEKIETKRNIFLTGGAGTGKSWSVNKLLSNLPQGYRPICTATTGMASLAYSEGETIHRALALGVDMPLKKIFRSYKFVKEAAPRMRRSRLLVIDEISMLRSDIFGIASSVLQEARLGETGPNLAPMGGIQCLFVGDFLQLPPVVRPDERKKFKRGEEFCFKSELWSRLNLETINLVEIKRSSDLAFAEMLNKIRRGLLDSDADAMIRDAADHRPPDGVRPILLRSTNAEVHQINQVELGKNHSDLEIYQADVSGVDEFKVTELVRDCPAENKLELKVGAQVIIIRNDSDGNYVNGSMGVYWGMEEREFEYQGEWIEEVCANIELLESKEMVHVRKAVWRKEKHDPKTGKTVMLAECKQYPVKLGYAITIHKSQGQSIDYLEVDLQRCFAPGMAYVALSRARSFAGLCVKNYRRNTVKTNPHCLMFYEGLK